jgi:hypothetical protein
LDNIVLNNEKFGRLFSQFFSQTKDKPYILQKEDDKTNAVWILAWCGKATKALSQK